MINNYLRKDLLDFKNYHVPTLDYKIKLDANENPFFHSENVMAKAIEWLQEKDNLTRYPDNNQNSLREKIGTTFGVTKDNVICGVGSDQIIEYILKVFIDPGDTILVPSPSFSMYQLSNTLNHGKTVEYELEDDFSYNIEKIIDLYQIHNPKVIFICSPNNPTGTIISKAKLKQLLEVVKCPVVIDEAYGEFIDDGMISEINYHKQIVILKTFSKAFGLAGLRVGYGIGSTSMIDAISIAKAPYNLSSFSAAMAEMVLTDIEYYKENIKLIKENRDYLFENLKKVPVIDEVYPSEGNFILIKVKDTGVANHLQHFRILVRGYGNSGRLANCIRLTIGNKEENEMLLKRLNEFYKLF
ncbi:MAG: histidinol-phosphate transaminase [Firmicutes bacterium HGW-Firmicutes-1]|jgi:histidinol-phosphate aminotransferase|nr:MAG: histidinol-phosphate transaminase [Firmicutes bacterium HGW-Firmicutes-1]